MPGARRFCSLVAIGLVALLTLVSAGCTPRGPEFVDAGASYDQAAVTALAKGIDTAKLAETPSSKAAGLRHEALVGLRSRGGSAVAIADMMTKTFSAETRGVPVYFERATYNGTPAIIVVEAVGPNQGKLSTRRVWVLDEKGGVLYAGGQ